MKNKKHMVIAGGSGFLGRVLAAHFQAAGWQITILTRSPNNLANGICEIKWDGTSPGGWMQVIDGADAVINLTGRSVNCRYHTRNRRLIMDSRINSTRVIGEAIANSKLPPQVWLNASTATIYKHTFGPPWDEAGEIGGTPEAKDEFSVQVATHWEKALNETPTPQTRKIAMRTAMVFGMGQNSVFPALRTLTRIGLGGRMGNGKQYVSWIHETDFCRAVEWLIGPEQLSGPINLCSPNPVTNAEMMKIVREVCGLPLGLPATKWMLEIGTFVMRTETELLIKSRRVAPGALLKSGFEFKYPFLRETVEELNNRERKTNEYVVCRDTCRSIHQPSKRGSP